MLELAYRADSNSAAREGLWVPVPPAVPGLAREDLPCRAAPPDAERCVDDRGLGFAYPVPPWSSTSATACSLPHHETYGAYELVWTPSTRQIFSRSEEEIDQFAARTVCAGPDVPAVLELYSNWKHWICLFPQHGRGPKHLRQIALEPWQEHLVTQHSGQFRAGLIHSDGCRCVNRVKGHEYPRYFSRTCPWRSQRCSGCLCTRPSRVPT